MVRLSASITGGGGESLFHRPLHQVEPAVYGSVVDAGFARPLHQCLRLAVEGYEAVVRFVVGLGFRIGPTTIFRGIRPIVVDAVKEKIRSIRTLIVGNEVGNIKPSFAYRNSTPPVSIVANISGLKASILHAMPYLVEWVFGKAMNGFSAEQASARFNASTSQSATGQSGQRAAIALTIPLGLFAVSRWIHPDNSETAKALFREVDDFSRHSPSLLSKKVIVYG